MAGANRQRMTGRRRERETSHRSRDMDAIHAADGRRGGEVVKVEESVCARVGWLMATPVFASWLLIFVVCIMCYWAFVRLSTDDMSPLPPRPNRVPKPKKIKLRSIAKGMLAILHWISYSVVFVATVGVFALFVFVCLTI